MSWRAVLVGLVSSGLIAACGAPPASSDAGVDSGVMDAGHGDDAGSMDAGEPDAGDVDAGEPDAGEVDAGDVDAGEPDAGLSDSGTPDAGQPDAGPIDAGFTDAGVGPDGCLLPSGVGAAFRIRAVAANLTSGNYQSWDPGPGQRILEGLQPDIVLIQEFNYGNDTETEFRGFVDAVCGTSCEYVRGATGSIPNGVISRWPIVASGDWTDPRVGNRAFTWAHIDLPGPRDLWAVSLHLLTTSANERNLEAQSLVSQLTANVPANDFLLIGGDFNTGSRTENCVSTLGQRTVTAAPHPEDQDGVPGTNASRSKPYDWVLASRCLQKNQVPVVVGAQQYDAGLVFDSRVYVPLADVAPVLQSDSAAPQMQHMAVVKDFFVQP